MKFQIVFRKTLDSQWEDLTYFLLFYVDRLYGKPLEILRDLVYLNRF